MVTTLFNNVPDENEKCAFYFYLKKKKEFFGQPNSWKTTTTVICIMFTFDQEEGERGNVSNNKNVHFIRKAKFSIEVFNKFYLCHA